MSVADPVFKKDKVSQRFDLKEMFGVDVSAHPEIREAVAGTILEKIRERTLNGAGFGGAPFNFGVYSDEYAESIEFQAAGKDQQEVNMSLSGDMLGLMDLIDQGGNSIEIGWEDPTQNAKAFNHNTGDTVPKRPFFGLSKAEVREISEELSDAVKEAAGSQQQSRDQFVERALGFLASLEGDDGE